MGPSFRAVGKGVQIRAANREPGKEGAPMLERTSRINALQADATCMPPAFGTAVPLLPARMTQLRLRVPVWAAGPCLHPRAPRGDRCRRVLSRAWATEFVHRFDY